MKVAGTSVEAALSAVMGPDDIITPITPFDEYSRLKVGARGAQNYSVDIEAEKTYLQSLMDMTAGERKKYTGPEKIFYNHMGFAEIESLNGALQDGWHIFCVERCPYRKIISWANMRLSSHKYRQGREMVAPLDEIKAFLSVEMKEDTFVKVRNIDRYRRADGRLAPETVLRYENLDRDFADLRQKLNLPANIRLPHFKKGIGANDILPEEVFEPWQLQKINSLFGEEFEVFGYDRVA